MEKTIQSIFEFALILFFIFSIFGVVAIFALAGNHTINQCIEKCESSYKDRNYRPKYISDIGCTCIDDEGIIHIP